MDLLDRIRKLIGECLDKLYTDDATLFKRNNGRGISERGLVFRFAHYLQNKLPEYYLDCDFNSSFEYIHDTKRNTIATELPGKKIKNPDGTTTKRFVDIIVHRRDPNPDSNFICFEFKKWNNNRKSEFKKDINNLTKLTSKYGYKYGFHIILGKNRKSVFCIVLNSGVDVEGCYI